MQHLFFRRYRQQISTTPREERTEKVPNIKTSWHCTGTGYSGGESTRTSSHRLYLELRLDADRYIHLHRNREDRTIGMEDQAQCNTGRKHEMGTTQHLQDTTFYQRRGRISAW